MVKPSRRDFLIGSAGAALLTSSSVSALAADGELAADVSGVLSATPTAAALDTTYRTLVVYRVDGDEESDTPHQARPVTSALGADPDDVAVVLAAAPADHRRRFTVAAGSFEAPDGEAVETVGEWTVTDDGDAAVAHTDGYAAVATGEDRVATATAVARAGAGEADDVRSNDRVRTAFDAIGAHRMRVFAPDASRLGIADAEGIAAFAAGFERSPTAIDGEATHEYVCFPADGVSLEDATVESFVAEAEYGVLVETTLERVDGAVHVTATVEEPPEHAREAAPDARVRTTFDAEEGVLTLRHAGGEAIPADTLQLWHDGELAETQPAASFDAVEPGDELTVETGPLGTVVLRWFDEAENRQRVYVSEAVDREAFAFDHAFADETVTVTYEGEPGADAGVVEVTHRGDRGYVPVENAFGDAGDALEPGDAVTVEGVEVGDRVEVDLDLPEVPGVSTGSLASFHAAPPRLHVSQHPDEGVVVRYHDETERSAEAFEVRVDGEPASTQPADEHETLTRGDAVPLGELPLGSRVTVVWTEPAEPVTVAERDVVPRVHASMEYDGDAGTVTVTHRDGRALDAADLVLRADGEPTATQPEDAFDEFAVGDSVSVDVGPFTDVELAWTGGEEEHVLGWTTTARDAIVGTYDGDAERLTLTYTGGEPADPEPLTARHRDADGDSPREIAFASVHDRLTEGDEVVVEDVGVEDRVTVTLTETNERGRSVQSVGHFQARPHRAFAFRSEESGQGLVAEYVDRVRRPAEEFEVRVDGEPAGTQPADAHDTLARGDTVDLGEVARGSAVVVTWTVPDEPVELTEHVVPPQASFAVAYDDDAGTVTVTHEGGDAIAADDLGVALPPALTDLQPWDADGKVSAGDETTFEVSEAPDRAFVVFRERTVLTRVRLDE